MAGYRAERIAEMVHKEVARRLYLEVKDPRMEPISITNVTVTKDLQSAGVSFLPLGGGAVSDELAEALVAAGKAMRGPIGRVLRLRRAPTITFVEDLQFEQAIRVTNLLDKFSAERAIEEE